jgi:hypothetical protein
MIHCSVKNISAKMKMFSMALLLITGVQYTHAQKKSVKSKAAKSAYYPAMIKLDSAITRSFYNDTIGYYNERTKPEKNENNNRVSYLWPLCGMIQAYNEIGLARQQKGKVVNLFSGAITKYYDARPPAPGYASYPPEFGGGDRFYDDNQWIGIALMDNWKAEGGQLQLDKAKEIFRFMMTAYDTAAGGGLYWQEGKMNGKNTCSNGPGVILALQLFQATKEQSYLDTALLLYNWTNQFLMDEDGLYFDNISVPGRKLDKKKYSYNTGTMLQSGVYLYQITGDKKYLDLALKTAESSVPFFYGTGQFIDGCWFNAVLLRAYQHLFTVNEDPKYLAAFKKSVDYALHSERRQDGLQLSKNHPVDLTNQAGMLEILARFVQIENAHGPL